jgi:hypothetical protein
MTLMAFMGILSYSINQLDVRERHYYEIFLRQPMRLVMHSVHCL